MTRLRVCYVVGAQPDVPCGIGDYTAQLARDVAGEGAVVGLITTRDSRFVAPPGVDVVDLVPDWSIGSLRRLLHATRSWSATVVHVQFPGVGYGRAVGVTLYPLAVRLTSGPRRPRVAVTLHEFEAFSWRWRARVAIGFSFGDVITAPDRALAGRIVRALRMVPGRAPVRFLPLGSNVHSGPPNPDGPLLRRHPDELVIGFFGFFGPDKGLETLLDAFALVRQTRQAVLALVGSPGTELDYWRTVRERITRSVYAKDVREVGWVPAGQLASVLEQFDVCALPYRDGVAMNRTSFQAAISLGLPTVTTSAATKFDPVMNTEYVRPADPQALAGAVLRAAARHRTLAPISSVPSRQQVARDHLRLYASLVGNTLARAGVSDDAS